MIKSYISYLEKEVKAKTNGLKIYTKISNTHMGRFRTHACGVFRSQSYQNLPNKFIDIYKLITY